MSAGEIYGCTWDKGVRQSYVRVLNIFFSIILMNNKYIIRIFLKELSVHGYFRVLDLAAVGTIVDIFGRRRVGMRFKPITYPIQRADALCATPPLLRVYILSWIMFRIRSCRFLRIFTYTINWLFQVRLGTSVLALQGLGHSQGLEIGEKLL